MHEFLPPDTIENGAQSTLSAGVEVAEVSGFWLVVFQPLRLPHFCCLQRLRCAGAILFCLAHDSERACQPITDEFLLMPR
jgi:hypothetical protein